MPIGELAALGTAFCFAMSALAFAWAGERIGSMAVNLIRLVIGFVMLMGLGWALRGNPLPTDASAHAWLWLGISGLVGFTFGDGCLFRAFVLLGPRLSAVVMALAPPIAALVGWLWLGERLGPRDLIGMTLTVAGIAWAIWSREPASPGGPKRPLAGLLFALGGAAGQAVGLVLSKLGMGSYDAFAATQIRVIGGAVGFAVLFAFVGWWPQVFRSLRDAHAMRWTTVGAFFGPFVGVGLSLLAVQNTETGVAASIMATQPIVIIPFAIWLRGERVGLGGLAGAVVAVAGVALLFS